MTIINRATHTPTITPPFRVGSAMGSETGKKKVILLINHCITEELRQRLDKISFKVGGDNKTTSEAFKRYLD